MFSVPLYSVYMCIYMCVCAHTYRCIQSTKTNYKILKDQNSSFSFFEGETGYEKAFQKLYIYIIRKGTAQSTQNTLPSGNSLLDKVDRSAEFSISPHV